jgi:hypothetical protein
LLGIPPSSTAFTISEEVGMKRSRFGALALVLAVVVAASTAAATASATGDKAGTTAETATATVDVKFAVQRFVVRNRRLVAVGHVIGRYISAQGIEVTRQPFAVPVKRIKARMASPRMQARPHQANRICDILSLNLAPLRLELLGLIVELDRVVLTIKADSNGGLLGSLLCGLAGPGRANRATAAQLTRAARQSGLASGTGFQVPILVPAILPAPGSGTASYGPHDLPPVPPGVCTILDLVIGPLDLNLLGLLVHLDRTQLRITADPRRGILGSLLCGLAGGPPTPATARV